MYSSFKLSTLAILHCKMSKMIFFLECTSEVEKQIKNSVLGFLNNATVHVRMTI